GASAAEGQGGEAGGGRALANALVLAVFGAGWLGAPAGRPDTTGGGGGAQAVRPDTTGGRRAPGVPGAPVSGQRLDTATARKLGLPSAPTRSFPVSDPVMDSLLKLPGFRVTQYVADTLIVKGDSQAIQLRGEAY